MIRRTLISLLTLAVLIPATGLSAEVHTCRMTKQAGAASGQTSCCCKKQARETPSVHPRHCARKGSTMPPCCKTQQISPDLTWKLTPQLKIPIAPPVPLILPFLLFEAICNGIEARILPITESPPHLSARNQSTYLRNAVFRI